MHPALLLAAVAGVTIGLLSKKEKPTGEITPPTIPDVDTSELEEENARLEREVSAFKAGKSAREKVETAPSLESALDKLPGAVKSEEES